MKAPTIYYGVLAVFCVIALCIGFASAADTAQGTHTYSHGKGTGHPGFDLTNTTVQQEILARYTKQGVDTTGLAAAFQSGNMTDVKTWMGSHRPAAPGFAKGSFRKTPDLTNTTVQQEILARYTKQGVDITGLAAAFQSGNMTDVKTWMGSHRPGAPGFAKGSFGKTPDLTNTTVQQEILARYTKQGVDTTGLAAAFQSGNMTDVKTWMGSHRPAAPGFAKGSFGKTPDLTNTTVQQEILARYTKQGVDTTGLAAAFQSGNMTDVKTWMGSHRPAAPGFAKGSFGKTPDLTNTTVQQEILTRFDNQGVDTSALRTAFQNGDASAVKSWFDAFFKAHPRTGHGQSGGSKASA